MTQDTVKVSIRVRPFIRRETDGGCENLWDYDTHQIKPKNTKDKAKLYMFDRVFGDDETTEDVYEEIAEPIVQSAMQGFNGTVFAYGQTASGKTYTMLGSQGCPGVIPMAVHKIFSIIEETPEREFLLRMSYLEIYNENLKDLLATGSSTLNIREDEFKNVKVSGLLEELVTTERDVMQYMEKGEKLRHMASTNMNERSSRSHTICRMIIESRERLDMNRTREADETAVKVAQLNFVDLAGSERASQTGAEGERLKEGGHINKSLMVLGQVINQICKDNELSGGSVFISFRDSKLTRILQPSLGGNSLTAIICTVSSAVFEETESTLRFASSAKQIKNKPKVNEVLTDEALLYRQKREINQLRKKISKMEKTSENAQSEKGELEEKITILKRMLLVSSLPADYVKKQQKLRRETWCPGAKGTLSHPLSYVSPNHHLLNTHTNQFSSIDHSTFIDDLEIDEKSRLFETSIINSSKRHLDDGATTSALTRKKTRFANGSDTPDLTTLRDKLKDLENDLEEQKKTNNALKAKELESAEEREKENHKSQLKISDLEGQLKLQEDLIGQFVSEQTSEEEIKKSLENKISELSKQVVDLERREISRVEGDTVARALQGQVEDLHGQLSETCRENRKLQQQIDSETEQSRVLSSSLDQLTLDISRVKDDAAHEIQQYKQKMSSLQSQLEASLSSTKSPDHTDKYESEISILRSELASKDVRIGDLQDKLTEVNADYEKRLAKEESTLVSPEENKCNQSSFINLPKTSMIGERTVCLEEAIQHCELLIDEKEDLKTQMDDIMFKYMENKTGLLKLMEEKDLLASQVHSLEELVEFDRDEKEVMFEEEKALKLEIERLRICLEKSKEAKPQAVVIHQDELSKVKEELILHERSAKDAQMLLQDSNQKLSQAQCDINDLQQTIKSQTSEITNLQADLQSYVSMAEISSATKCRMERSINAGLDTDQVEVDASIEEFHQQILAKDEMKSLQHRNDDLVVEVDKYRAENESIIDGMERQRSMIAELENEIESMKLHVKELVMKLSIQPAEGVDFSSQTNDTTEQDENAELSSEIELLGDKVEMLQESLMKEQKLSNDLRVTLDNVQSVRVEEEIPCGSPKNESSQVERLLEDLTSRRKEIQELLAQNEKLKEKMHHTQGALLVESNKELDQQRLLEKADRAQKDSLAIIAQERNMSNKEIAQLQQHLEERQQALSKALVDKDIAIHQLDRQKEQCGELQLKVNDLQNSLDGRNRSLFSQKDQQIDSHKLETKIKQLSLNLDLTKQQLAKSEELNKQLKNENRKCESESIQYRDSQAKAERSNLDQSMLKVQGLEHKLDAVSKENASLLRKLMETQQSRQVATAETQRKIEQLEGNVKRLNLELTEKSNEKSAVQGELTTVKDEMARYEEQLEFATSEHDGVVEKAKETKISLTKQLEEMEIETTRHKQVVLQLESEMEQCKTNIASMENLLHEKEQEIQLISEQNKEFLQKQEELQESNIELKKAEDKLGKEVMELQNLLSEKQEKDTNVLEDTEIKEQSVLVEDLSMKVKDLEDKLKSSDDLEEELDLLKLENRRKTKESEHVEETLKKKEEEIVSINIQLEKMKVAESLNKDKLVVLDKLREENAILMETITQKENNLEELMSQLKENNSLVESLKTKINDSEIKLVEEQENLSDVEKKCESLRISLQDKLEEMENETTSHKEVVIQLEGEIEQCKTNIASMENLLHEKQQEIQLISKQNKEFLQKQEELQESNIELKKAEDKLGKEVMELQNLLSEKQEKDTNVLEDTEINEQSVLVEDLSMKVKDLEDKLKSSDDLEEELDLLKLENRRKTKESEHVEESLKKKEEEIVSINNQLEEIKVAESLYKEKLLVLDKLKEENAILMETITQKENNLEEIMSQLKENNSLVESLKTKINDSEMKFVEEQENLSDVEKKCESLRISLQDKLEEMENETTSHKQVVIQLEGEMEQCKTNIASMENLLHEKQQEIQLISKQNKEFLQKQEELQESNIASKMAEEKLGEKVMELQNLLSEKQEEVPDEDKDVELNNESVLVKDLSSKVKDLEERLKSSGDLEEELDLLKLENRRKTKESEHVVETLKKKEEEIVSINNQLEEMKVAESLNKEKLLVLDKLREEKAILMGTITQKENNLEEMMSQLKENNSLVESLKTKINDLERCLNEDKAEQMRLLEGQEHLSDVEKNFITLYHEFTTQTDTHSCLQEENSSIKLELSDCKQNLIEKSEELKEIHQKYETEQEEVKKICTDLENSTSEVLQLQGQLEEHQNMINRFEEELETERSKFKKVSTPESTYSKNLEEMQTELREMSDKHDVLLNENDEAKATLTETEEKLKSMSVELGDLSSKYDAEVTLRMDCDLELSRLKDEITKLNSDVTTFETKLEDSEQVLSLTKSELKQMLEENNQLKIEIEDLEKNLVSSKHSQDGRNNELETILGEKDETIRHLKSVVLKREKRLAECGTDLENAIESSKHEIQQQTTKNAQQYQAALTRYTDLLKDQQRQMEELKEKVKIAAEKHESKKDEVDRLKKQNDSLEEKLQLQLKKVDDSHVEEMKSKNELLEKKLAARSNRVRELVDTCKEIEQENEDYQAKIKELQENLYKTKNTGSGETEELREKNKLLERKLEARSNRVRELVDTCKEIEQENEDYQAKIKELQENLHTLKTPSPEETEELRERNKLLERKLEARSNRVRELVDTCKEIEQENEDYQAKIKELQENLHKTDISSHEKLPEIKKKYEKLEEEFKTCCSRVTELENKERLHKNEIVKYQSKIAQLDGAKENKMPPASAVVPGGIVQRTKADVMEWEMSKLRRQIKYLEKETAKYKEMDGKRRSENQEILDKYNKLRDQYYKIIKQQKAKLPVQQTSKVADAVKETPAEESLDNCKTQ